ncbi:carboxypeptidase-like regulatory domain-containing protein [Paludisphaera soli]|uniref:carboxypeptidase-like regulatory domain-containing protein n=1 Tax=Paludisphaera soli TaxID=2712865 RepID=UPI0013E9CF7F|nr:carboxypeptidase-like regulatory domain-containing protein [Paludisphaera soli]
MSRIATGLLLTVLALSAPQEASALITGGTGNAPLRDPGWPAGAAAIFNHAGRIAWWEGPPFGGGQWHAECRGDAKVLSAVLADFAKLEVKVKKVVLHDGVGHSFWIAPNREPEKLAAAKMDWAFTVWVQASWEQLRNLPPDLNPTGPGETSPPSQIDVYAAGIDWAAVTVPAGIEVDDQRLVTHGFTAADGAVLEGKVTDLTTGQPLAATMRLQRVEPQEKGGYLYPVAAEAKADGQGRWVLKKAPVGWVRVVVEAEGFVPRVAGYARLDDQPRWQSYDIGLIRSAPVSGRVIDEDDKPMADVDVSFGNVQAASGGKYESPSEYKFKTDAEGRFRAEQIPAGTASIWVHKPGHYGPGLGHTVSSPVTDVEVRMNRAGSVRVTVDFAGKERSGDYVVKISPEGGDVVGSFGGSGNIDAENRMNFTVLPPGRYVLTGRPNPGSDSEEVGPVMIDVKGGQQAEVTLKAK